METNPLDTGVTDLTFAQQQELTKTLEGYRSNPSNSNKFRFELFAQIQALINSEVREARLDESLKYPQSLYEQGMRDGRQEGAREYVKALLNEMYKQGDLTASNHEISSMLVEYLALTQSGGTDAKD